MTDSILNPDPLDPQKIAELAYRLWQQRGCPEGSGEEDWLEAEALMQAEASRQAEALRQSQAAAHPAAAAETLAVTPAATKHPRVAKAPKLDSAASAPKTRVSRARPARPDA